MVNEKATRDSKEPLETHAISILANDWKIRCEDSGMERNRVKEACASLEKRGVVVRNGLHVMMPELVRRNLSS
ncbi:hypothetical protein D3C84_1089020 [compost metagenome]